MRLESKESISNTGKLRFIWDKIIPNKTYNYSSARIFHWHHVNHISILITDHSVQLQAICSYCVIKHRIFPPSMWGMSKPEIVKGLTNLNYRIRLQDLSDKGHIRFQKVNKHSPLLCKRIAFYCHTNIKKNIKDQIILVSCKEKTL